jgi:peptidoglycan hydrolase-like protein with peptidoglycan-binding domain
MEETNMKKAKKLIALLCVVLICAQMFTMMASAANTAPKVSTSTGKCNAVMVLQKMLNYKRSAGLTTDGWFGTNTKKAVIAYQKKAFPNKPSEWDGICGPKTWEALFNDCFVKRGDKNNLVLIVQHILNKVDNQTLYEDGDFGYATYCAVWNFQSKHGLYKDGKVGPATWNELIYQYNTLSFDTAFSKK